MYLHVFRRAIEQLEISKSDGDSAYFTQLLYFGEFLSKMTTAALCAGISDDSDRHRYALLHRLVRADSIGGWAQVVDEIAAGPTSRLLRAELQEEKTQLNTRSTAGTWQYRSISLLDGCMRKLSPDRQGLPVKLEGRLWFGYFAELRNATRGHGILSPTLCADLSPQLRDSIFLFLDNFALYSREWAFLHMNMSGKYRVTKLGLTDDIYRPLKSSDPRKWGVLADGLYMFAGAPVRIDLIFTDPDLSDYFLPNGNFKSNGFETISYLTNAKRIESSAPYLMPASTLPASDTQGCEDLDVSGEAFTNIPELAQGYVPRPALEDKLSKILEATDRHPVISLVGRGGIGKTSLALHVLRRISHGTEYAAILWFSSRDIDLLPSGPKPVRPHLLNETEMAKQFRALLGQLISLDESEKPLELLSKSLTKSPLYRPLLFVFDNFETVSNPIQTYNWIDTYIRTPNKVLITSRFREFKGDYDVDVLGMEEEEARNLIAQVSRYLGIDNVVDEKISDEIFRESDGHPYVIKMLLGEIARQGKFVRFERIVAGKDEILDALFERSFVKLSPAAQLIFLTLSSWRSLIPRVAIEAVMLRQANEAIDVEAALSELKQSSFIEVIAEADENQDFISVPLSAAVFGRRRLEVSPMKLSVEANVQLLLFFGAGQKSDLRHGIAPRIERFFKRIAAETSKDEAKLSQYLPMLEYISRQYSPGWLLLAQLLEENTAPESQAGAMNAIRRFIEAAGDNPVLKRDGWQRLVRLAKAKGDSVTEIQGLMELCNSSDISFEVISETANSINSLSRWQTAQIAADERRLLAEKLLAVADARLGEADATDLSRFAWLCLSVGNSEKAKQYTLKGLQLDPSNEYCLRLAERQGLTIEA